MTAVLLWLLGAAVGGCIGWWLAREVNRGMPWGILILGVAVVLGVVAAPFVWPHVFTVPGASVTVGLASGFVTVVTVTVEFDVAERGPVPPPDPIVDHDPETDDR